MIESGSLGKASPKAEFYRDTEKTRETGPFAGPIIAVTMRDYDRYLSLRNRQGVGSSPTAGSNHCRQLAGKLPVEIVDGAPLIVPRFTGRSRLGSYPNHVRDLVSM